MKFQTKAKKSISLLLSLLMIISAFTALPFTAGAVNTDSKTTSAISGDFGYEILDDGTAEITGYNGEATELEIPSALDGYTVTSIGDHTFHNYESLTSVTIPDSVTSIGWYAFSCCRNLTDITIPDSVTSIGGFAFDICKSLTSITIPDSVTSIGCSPFNDCTALTNIEVNEKNTSYSSINGNLYNKNKTELIQYAVGKTDTSFTIPDGVTSIGDWAFAGCASLTNVTVPDSVASIGENAFENCENIKNITIPNSVTSIGVFAFEDCTSLTSITIPDSVTSIARGEGEYLNNSGNS